jgi:hypothetical protein
MPCLVNFSWHISNSVFFKETLFVLIEFLEFTFSFRVTFAVTWRGFAVAVRWEELFFLRKKSDLFLN